MQYDDDKVRDLTARAIDQGFTAFKLKVGSADENRDLRRAAMLRKLVGDSGTLMFDANQQLGSPGRSSHVPRACNVSSFVDRRAYAPG